MRLRLQRLAILLLVMCLVAGLEGMMLRTFTADPRESASAPQASPEPSADPAAPAATQGIQTQIPTPAPTMPGFTSPPVGGGGSSGSSSNNNSSSGSSSGNDSSSGSGNSSSSDSSSNNSSNNSAPDPTQPPAPTAAPTQPPPPTDPPGTTLGSGSFSSNTGVGLNLSVGWEAKDQGNGTCRVYINGTINSYSLNVASHPVSISLGGYSTSVMGKGLNVPEGGLQSNSLFSTYIDVPSGTSGTMSVSWRFGGTYSDVEIMDVVASGDVYTS